MPAPASLTMLNLLPYSKMSAEHAADLILNPEGKGKLRTVELSEAELIAIIAKASRILAARHGVKIFP